MPKQKIDLNAPAFGAGVQKIEDVSSEPVGQPEIKPKEEEIIVPDEQQVSYSRFKKFHDAAKEAEEEAAYWKAKATAIETEPVHYNEEMPSQWTKLYGDSEQSKEAWKVQQDLNRQIREDALREAREAVRNERYEEVQRTEENMETLDNNFETLEAFVGRTLTDKEQSDVLDAVDFLTAKDQYGNYAGALVPFEAAWDYVQAKAGSTKAPQRQSRDQVASLTGSQSQGEPNLSEKQERDKNWNPFAWDSYKTRL
jgi:uncharacterized protein with von Willebrand factor type A (vWA) domain